MAFPEKLLCRKKKSSALVYVKRHLLGLFRRVRQTVAAAAAAVAEEELRALAESGGRRI